jgi:TonB family protein
VRADGTVGEVCVVRSLDRRYGLDDEAVKALKQWQFTPCQKDGVAVPVVVEVEMTFMIGKPR